MKRILATATALTLLATGCLYVPRAKSGSALSAQKCPPGHQWSDGRCHDKGKGHDPGR